MRSTFKVLFYLKCNAPKKDGLIPVMCRITINGKIAQFSCKLDVEEKSWNVELGRVSGRSIAAQETNRMLDKYCTGYNHLAEFIEKKYKVSDIALKKLVPPFITDFELFLKIEKNHCNNTV